MIDDITYIDKCIWNGIKSKQFKRKHISGVKIIKITKKTHILKGEYGLFATKIWKTFDIIGQYTGQIVTPDIEGIYVANMFNDTYKDDLRYSVNAEIMGNETRYINDYRGIKDKPNCKFIKTYIEGLPVIAVVVIIDINKGDEILTDYGDDYWDATLNSK